MTLDLAGTTLCSAGVSYFHVYPNGDVYRCLADYNARRAPMFNLKRDGWQGGVEPTVCDHERCYNACDLDWTTKWQVDEQGRLEKTIEGQRKDTDKEVSAFLCSQRLEAPQRRMAYFIWSPTLACNYTCAYCGCAAGEKRLRDEFPSSHPELSVDEWIDIWADVLERFDYGILSITGGEPLLSEATIPVLGVATQKFACYMTSNISRNIMEFTRGGIRPGAPRVVEGFGEVPVGLSGINCSLHPTSKGFNWELFKGSTLLLRNAGFKVSVNYVGYPLQLYLAPEYKAWCEQNQVEFTLSSWQGVDNDGNVSRYSLPERTFFEELAPSHRKKANELVFMDCRYEVQLDAPLTPVLMADVVMLTGRIRNLSPNPWQVGSGAGRWRVAGYLTRIGRRKQWMRELRAADTPDGEVLENGELAFSMPIDTRGLSAGIYELWIDMLMDRRNWMALHGAVPFTAPLRIESFSHEIAVDADAVPLPAGGSVIVNGTVRNACGKPWPESGQGEPLRIGARLFDPSDRGEAVREFRAHLDRLPQTPDEEVPFHLVLDSGELARGHYELSIDLVKEQRFWLAEKGATPKIVPVVIG